ncbi:PREDICTED: protein phosphatase 1 regulatory subunit 15A [Crocodylus porosus]|uniref:Protein phosphatase 1 regulatory subunit 15A n=1 Tax=Crocodylus porosus TaxID=8502 RepID=A0A7M4FFW9_CROPO|nr:PREDICTED: protein phosphatase 1 regulatory subunit 15A [Crocodylus porosus]
MQAGPGRRAPTLLQAPSTDTAWSTSSPARALAPPPAAGVLWPPAEPPTKRAVMIPNATVMTHNTTLLLVNHCPTVTHCAQMVHGTFPDPGSLSCRPTMAGRLTMTAKVLLRLLRRWPSAWHPFPATMRMMRKMMESFLPACSGPTGREGRLHRPPALDPTSGKGQKLWEALEKGDDTLGAALSCQETDKHLEDSGEGTMSGREEATSFQEMNTYLEDAREGTMLAREEATGFQETDKHLERLEDSREVQKQLLANPQHSQEEKEHPGMGGASKETPKGGERDATISLLNGTKDNEPITKSSLVLSLFYCPSEEEDGEGEDWSSKEEDGGSDSGWSDTEEEEETDLENEELWRSLSCGHDPSNPLCCSTSSRGQKAASDSCLPQNQDQVSCLGMAHSLEAGTAHASQSPWPMRRWESPHRVALHYCEPGSRRAEDPVMTETACDQEGNRAAKKVHFSPVVTVHPLIVWDFASRAARCGPWEQLARDRCRFHRRIEQAQAVLGPCLEPGHRAKAWRRINRATENPGIQENQATSCSTATENPSMWDKQAMSLPLCSTGTENPDIQEGRTERYPSLASGEEDPGIRNSRLG